MYFCGKGGQGPWEVVFDTFFDKKSDLSCPTTQFVSYEKNFPYPSNFGQKKEKNGLEIASYRTFLPKNSVFKDIVSKFA